MTSLQRRETKSVDKRILCGIRNEIQAKHCEIRFVSASVWVNEGQPTRRCYSGARSRGSRLLGRNYTIIPLFILFPALHPFGPVPCVFIASIITLLYNLGTWMHFVARSFKFYDSFYVIRDTSWNGVICGEIVFIVSGVMGGLYTMERSYVQ